MQSVSAILRAALPCTRSTNTSFSRPEEVDAIFSLIEELHVPVDKVIHITLMSKDVIHRFFLPHLRLKRGAVWPSGSRPRKPESIPYPVRRYTALATLGWWAVWY